MRTSLVFRVNYVTIDKDGILATPTLLSISHFAVNCVYIRTTQYSRCSGRSLKYMKTNQDKYIVTIYHNQVASIVV